VSGTPASPIVEPQTVSQQPTKHAVRVFQSGPVEFVVQLVSLSQSTNGPQHSVMRHAVQASVGEIAELQTDVTAVAPHRYDPPPASLLPPEPPVPPMPPVPDVGALTQTRGAPIPLPLQTKPLGHSPLSEHWVLPL